MSKLKIHDEASAPAAARPALEVVKAANGMIPNMLGVLAEIPAALDGYFSLSRIFDTAGLTPLERLVVLLAVSIENTCHFCVAAHSAASAPAGLDMTITKAVRNNQPLPDPRLEGLRLFARRRVPHRGFVSDADVTVFLKAGWDKSAIPGVILGVALKTISTYTNHVSETPLNPP